MLFIKNVHNFLKNFLEQRLHACNFFHVCSVNNSFYLDTNNRHTFTTYDLTISTQPSLLTQFRYLFGQKTPVSQHSLWQLLLIISGLVFILYFLSTDSGVNTKLGKKTLLHLVTLAMKFPSIFSLCDNSLVNYSLSTT